MEPPRTRRHLHLPHINSLSLTHFKPPPQWNSHLSTCLSSSTCRLSFSTRSISPPIVRLPVLRYSLVGPSANLTDRPVSAAAPPPSVSTTPTPTSIPHHHSRPPNLPQRTFRRRPTNLVVDTTSWPSHRGGDNERRPPVAVFRFL